MNMATVVKKTVLCCSPQGGGGGIVGDLLRKNAPYVENSANLI